MKPEDLLGASDDQAERKQDAFDKQCFKEFIRRLSKRFESVVDADDGQTPWQRLEDQLGQELPYFILGRRVEKFSLINLMLGRRLTKDPLLEAFEDTREIAGDRQVAMIFKVASDQFRKIPGTKMVMTDTRLEEVSGIWLAHTSPVIRVVTYADWVQEFVNGYGHLFQRE